MHQISLWQDLERNDTERVINVASVPLRSPFRYPGGKTWLVPYIRQWLYSKPTSPELMLEPFAGGGIVSLTAIAERLVKHAIVVELDEQVAAVWHTIINDSGGGEWLAEKIINFELSANSVREALDHDTSSTREIAFKTILKNRVNRGGILAPGAGLVKHGENGKGLSSRWYPGTLRKRIIEITRMRDRITFIEGDGLEILKRYQGDPNAVYFIDPPYTVSGKRAGARLYTYPNIDHEGLFNIAENLKGDCLITYDDTEEVKELALKHGFCAKTVAMKNTHHAKMKELLISKDFMWL